MTQLQQDKLEAYRQQIENRDAEIDRLNGRVQSIATERMWYGVVAIVGWSIVISLVFIIVSTPT